MGSFDVYAVDENGNPATGQKVDCHFTYMFPQPGTHTSEWTDSTGHAGFDVDELHKIADVTIWVGGKKHGPYAVSDGAAFTVEM